MQRLHEDEGQVLLLVVRVGQHALHKRVEVLLLVHLHQLVVGLGQVVGAVLELGVSGVGVLAEDGQEGVDVLVGLAAVALQEGQVVVVPLHVQLAGQQLLLPEAVLHLEVQFRLCATGDEAAYEEEGGVVAVGVRGHPPDVVPFLLHGADVGVQVVLVHPKLEQDVVGCVDVREVLDEVVSGGLVAGHPTQVLHEVVHLVAEVVQAVSVQQDHPRVCPVARLALVRQQVVVEEDVVGVGVAVLPHGALGVGMEPSAQPGVRVLHGGRVLALQQRLQRGVVQDLLAVKDAAREAGHVEHGGVPAQGGVHGRGVQHLEEVELAVRQGAPLQPGRVLPGHVLVQLVARVQGGGGLGPEARVPHAARDEHEPLDVVLVHHGGDLLDDSAQHEVSQVGLHHPRARREVQRLRHGVADDGVEVEGRGHVHHLGDVGHGVPAALVHLVHHRVVQRRLKHTVPPVNTGPYVGD